MEVSSVAEYQLNLNDLLEYKKLVAKMEDEMEQKENKLESIMKVYQDLKSIHEKTRMECGELNQKMIKSYDEKSAIERKYKAEISKIESVSTSIITIEQNNSKQREIYEQQILKLSSYDPESLRNKLYSEIDIKYKQQLNQKDFEIEDSNNSNFEFQRKYNLLLAEYETYKDDIAKELNTMRDIHQSEIRELLLKLQLQSEKANVKIDKETFRDMKLELESTRRQITDLSNDVFNLRKEKEKLTMERNEIKLNSMREIDRQKFTTKVLTTENERLNSLLKSIQEDSQRMKDQFNEKKLECRDFLNDKLTLEALLREKEEEFNSFKSEIIALRANVENNLKEHENALKENHYKVQTQITEEKKDKENYQKQIEDLTLELRETKINFKNYYESYESAIQTIQRDYYIIQEEKRMLITKLSEIKQEQDKVKEEYENKINSLENYEKEYLILQEKYRNLSRKEYEIGKEKETYEKMMNEKDKEIKTLKLNLNSLKQGKGSNSDLIKKYNELMKKKNHYKSQCKVANENVQKIIQQLQPKDRETINIKDNEFFVPSQSEESGAF